MSLLTHIFGSAQWVMGKSLLVLVAGICGSANAQTANEPAKASSPLPLEQLTEAELIQQLVSSYLLKAESAQADARLEQMTLIMGDLRRTTQLPPERMRQLEIAAKGAVDRSMEGWRSAQENQVRQQTSGLPLEMVDQRLQTIGPVYTGSDDVHEQSLWTRSLSQFLTAEEFANWSNAQQERQTYRQQALVAILMAEVDRQLGVTFSQAERLEPLAATALADYLPDMMNYIDRNNGVDLRMLLLMLSGIPEQSFRQIVTPTQHDRWSQLTADYRGWWQNIEQNHRARLNRPSQQRAREGVQIQNGQLPKK